ncbi:CRISPR system precrRNA processing endoribonuclease RAMP protein Cas6, partial [Thiolapillus sp.]
NRQKRHMKLGGLHARIIFELSGIEQWWPLLWSGQWFHVGKQTSMGLGRYRLSEIDCSHSRTHK